MNTSNIGEYGRSVTITIPYDVNLKTLMVVTVGGNVQINNCSSERFFVAETQSGNVVVNGGSSEVFFDIETKSGKAFISGTALPVRGVEYGSAKFSTDYGTIIFQPKGSVWDYCYRLDTGEEAQIYVNGKQYNGGGGNINNFSHSQIDVIITSGGSLIVQDLNMGKLSLDESALQPNTIDPTLQTNAGNDTLPMSKEEPSSYWTEDDFMIFMQDQEETYRELLRNGDISQEEFDIYVLGDKETLKEIQNGVKISKAATGSIENGLGYFENKTTFEE